MSILLKSFFQDTFNHVLIDFQTNISFKNISLPINCSKYTQSSMIRVSLNEYLMSLNIIMIMLSE